MRKSATALIAITLILVSLGMVMLASTSSIQAGEVYKDPFFFLKRQALALLVGFAGAVICMRVPYPYWKGLSPLIGALAVILLIMALIPGIGINLKGSSRWLRLGPFNLQPSEIGKFALIIGLAYWMSMYQRRMQTLGYGMMVPLLIFGVLAGLVFIAPDFGTTMLMGVVAFSMMFVAGTRFGYLVIAAVSGLSLFAFAIAKNPERLSRVIAFMDREKYEQDEAFQLTQAIYAFVVGGWEGVGLGGSLQKRHYLPEAHTDFIFAILGEELGLIASLSVIILFAAFFFLGLYISHNAHDFFGKLLAFGITMMVSVQAAINMGVVTGVLPTKGLALPFISYGGTSLVMSLCMVGVLVNIAFRSHELASAGVVRGDRSIDI